MNDKLQQLTERLYEEGLAKGRIESEELVQKAAEQAAHIIAEANVTADRIVSEARARAEESSKNALTELTIASRGVVATLKQQIAELVVAQTVKEPLHKALTPEFIRTLLLELARNWKGRDTGPEAILPQTQREELSAAFEAGARELLQAGVEVTYSPAIKSGFRLAERGGHYYISFSEDDFMELLGGYLKDNVKSLLYGGE